ncbi:MAG: DoxX family protein [Patescibacteria group bacterium]|nr:DoxX family protein [Patescibacteria group bacterium]
MGLSQYSYLAVFLLRVVVAAIFIVHSLPKLKNAKTMAGGMGMPAGAVSLLGVIEFLSALGVLSGIFMRTAAGLLILVMLGAVYKKIFNWKINFTAMDKTGWEFDLLLLTANLVIFFSGKGVLGF